MTTMQEALADRYLKAAEVPDFLADTARLMNTTFANPKYGPQGMALVDGTNASDSEGYRGGIPSKRQNKIRSGRSGRKAARGRQDLSRVGGIWDARFPAISIAKAIYAPADKELCRVKGDKGTETKARVAGTPRTSSTKKSSPRKVQATTSAPTNTNTSTLTSLTSIADKYKGIFSAATGTGI